MRPNALIEIYESFTGMTQHYSIPCELVTCRFPETPTVPGMRLSIYCELAHSGELSYRGRLAGGGDVPYSGGCAGENESLDWSVTMEATPGIEGFNSGEGTLHREKDQDGRVAYVGSWWESWGAGLTLQKYSGLWIVRMGGSDAARTEDMACLI